eukprot:GEMP01010935.1.p1 GENE.GEMP01010935.1~~GEMP01010935.1.p1  ORF type:complete len:811 (+),score=127.17 GEMP01010935.1:3-2435(+)
MSDYPCWVYVEGIGDIPQSRSGHTCALHKNRYLFVFGGFDGSACFDDLYCLDLETESWRKCDPGGDLPSGRASHSAVTDDLAGAMYIFGGSGSHFGYTNKRDLYEFSFETQWWTILSNPLEETPSARYGQSMVQYKEGLYVWGGTHGTNYPTDMHRFDMCSKQWEFVVTMGDLPCGRYRHQAMVKEDVMYIVGGSGINRYGDVYLFRFDTNLWSKLMTTGADLSDGRYAHSTVLRGNSIYLYGGNDGVRHDDLLQLDLETRVWSRVQVQGLTPPGRDFHAAVLLDDSMVIFGGSSGMRRHNDTYDFRLAARVPPCTLRQDMGLLLEKSQHDSTWQTACDVIIRPKDDSAHGVYCHSHVLFVRCPNLLPQKERDAFQRSVGLARHGGDRMRLAGRLNSGASAQKDEAIDDLLREVGSVSQSSDAVAPPPPSAATHGNMPVDANPQGIASSPSRSRSKVVIDVGCCAIILWNLLHYLYTEEVMFGRLSMEQLFLLYTTASEFGCVRLSALCERQLKNRMNLENIMLLLMLSAQQIYRAQPIMDACKHFFLVNYNKCAELQECERLDPRLLCELMRLHNQRVVNSVPRDGEQWGNFVGNMGSKFGGSIAAGGSDNVPATVIPPKSLQDDLRRLLGEEIGCDFTVQVQGETIPVHKAILVARCNYFASCLLTSGMLEAQTHKLVIPTGTAMTAPAFRAFLKFVYAEDVPTPKEAHTAMYLIDAASFYGLTNARLKYYCEACVKNSFNEAHVLQLFEASSSLEVEAVRAMALDFIVNHFDKMGNQSALYELDKSLLVEILRGLAKKFCAKPASLG